eukprot:s880_g5.t1
MGCIFELRPFTAKDWEVLMNEIPGADNARLCYWGMDCYDPLIPTWIDLNRKERVEAAALLSKVGVRHASGKVDADRLLQQLEVSKALFAREEAAAAQVVHASRNTPPGTPKDTWLNRAIAEVVAALLWTHEPVSITSTAQRVLCGLSSLHRLSQRHRASEPVDEVSMQPSRVAPRLWRRMASKSATIVDIGEARAPSTARAEMSPAEEIRAAARHPRMSSLHIKMGQRTATLKRKEVSVDLPLAQLREKLRAFGWEAENCHQPLLLFGDDQDEVQKAHSILLEEGFTAVSNAQTREAVVQALRKPPKHLRAEQE